LAPDLVKQLCSTDTYLFFSLWFCEWTPSCSGWHCGSKSDVFCAQVPNFCTITIHSARTFQLIQKSYLSNITERLPGRIRSGRQPDVIHDSLKFKQILYCRPLVHNVKYTTL
jgi:hypothetical protein